MGDNSLERDIPGSWWKSIGKIWFDMECDWTRDYVNKMFKPSKIDQVLNFYGIPFIYKNEYKKYLKYRIQPRHCWIVNDYFLQVLRQEWYDTSDFDYSKLQEEYNERVPVPEHTWLDLHINYDLFLQKDKEHRDAIAKETDNKKDEQIQTLQTMMQQMMQQMQTLQKQVWDPNVLLSNNDKNDWTSPSWSDSTTNATWNQETPLEEDGNSWTTGNETSINSDWSTEVQWASEWVEWSELIWSKETDWDDWFWTTTEPFKIWWDDQIQTEKPTKDRRSA